jgi:hypothetical protein
MNLMMIRPKLKADSVQAAEAAIQKMFAAIEEARPEGVRGDLPGSRGSRRPPPRDAAGPARTEPPRDRKTDRGRTKSFELVMAKKVRASKTDAVDL